MRMRTRIVPILALMAAATATGMKAQTEVAAYQPGVTEEGITYFLPHTRLLVAVTATKTTHEPGEYARFARSYLRLTNVPLTAYDQWTITRLR